MKNNVKYNENVFSKAKIEELLKLMDLVDSKNEVFSTTREQIKRYNGQTNFDKSTVDMMVSLKK